jgi:hypothetical protein
MTSDSPDEPSARLVTCKVCPKVFRPYRSNHRFCSPSCRKRSHRREERKKLRDKLVAVIDEVLR